MILLILTGKSSEFIFSAIIVLFALSFYIHSVSFIKIGEELVGDSQYRILSTFLPILAGKSSEFILFSTTVRFNVYFSIYGLTFIKIGALLTSDSQYRILVMFFTDFSR